MKFIYIIFLTLLGCSGMDIKTFDKESPRFVFENYFIGEVKGTGIFFDRFSNLKRRFVVTLTGTKQEDKIILNELLVYSDGEKLERKYVITKINENLYEATANGIVGKAVIESYGNALKWKYSLEQKIGKSLWVLNFDDWMFLENEKLVLNRAKAYKFGIFLGEVFMSIEKTK